MSYPAPSPVYLGPAAHTSSGANRPIGRIVIHSTVSACVAGGARATAAYFRSQGAGGSAHYVVDPHEVVQVVYDNTIAWHAPPNGHSLGIELCDMPDQNIHRWDDAAHTAVLAHAADLVAQLCLAYDVPAVKLSVDDVKAGKHGICGHVDVSNAFHQSTHWDPGAFPWDHFLDLVHQAIKERTSPALPAAKATAPAAQKPAPVGPNIAAATTALQKAAAYGKRHPKSKTLGPVRAALKALRSLRGN